LCSAADGRKALKSRSASTFDGTLAALDAQGIQPERPPYRVREGGSRLCFVRDPDS
jgi:lactoylglutathione lyase